MKRREFLKVAAAVAGGVTANAAGQDVGEKDAAAASLDASGTQIEWSRQVPVRYEADVAVIGGGIAGVSAACAAARSGAKVILVERFAVTGGNMTSGGVANFCGQIEGQGEVFDAILADLATFGAISLPKTVFDHEILAVVLQELLLRRKVKVLLHTRFADVRVKNGRISECIICGK
ncbi:MAG: FAD-dependent oxidoreductase, partial [Planctomycetota bacterium]